MYCVHCGAEVKENQKFCGSCGANLSSSEKGNGIDPEEMEEEEEEYDEEEEEYEEEEYDDDEEGPTVNWPLIRKAIFLIAIVAALYMTNPSAQEVKVNVARTMIDLVSDKAGRAIGYDIRWLIDSGSFNDQQALKAAGQFGKISVEDYYLFKIGNYTPINKKESFPVTIGICGTTFSLLRFFKPWL